MAKNNESREIGQEQRAEEEPQVYSVKKGLIGILNGPAGLDYRVTRG